jgi:type I restriction enzyme S subunit
VSTMTSAEPIKIPEGYKQTEVGLIPEDWQVVQVQDVCGFIVPGRNKPEKFGGDIPWITTPDLTDGRIVYHSGSGLKISKEEAKSVGSKIVPQNSVIMSCVGELGIVAIAGCNMVLNQQLHAFLPSSKINSFYLAYSLKTQEKYFYSAATKTALPYLNKDNCNATPLVLPNIKEQTAIANALSDVDNLIASLETLIAKKSAIKTAAMQQLLTGKKRLPGFEGKSVKENKKQGAKQSGELDNTSETAQAVQTKQTATLNSDLYNLYKESGEGLDTKSNQQSEVGNANNKQTAPRPGYKQTELGEIPEDWEMVFLGDYSIISRLAGAEYTSVWKEDPTGEITALRGFNIGKNKIIERDLTRISNSLSMQLKRSRLTKGDVVYPCVGSIGNAVVITEDDKYHIQQNIARISPEKDRLCSEYLAHYLMSEIAFREVERSTATTSQPSVLVSSLREYRVPLPCSYQEQLSISEFLTAMDTELDALQQRLSKTQKIKQGMMQELLTGKTRLV